MENNKELIPKIPTHPGIALRDELKSRKMKQVEFAIKAGIHHTSINNIISGRYPITANIALKLETALNIPAQFWMNMQTNYELDCVKLKCNKTIEKPKNKLISTLEDLNLDLNINTNIGTIKENFNRIINNNGLTKEEIDYKLAKLYLIDKLNKELNEM